jgi:hypothetical protein
MIFCLNPVSRSSSEPGQTVLLDMVLPKSYARFPERMRSNDDPATMRPRSSQFALSPFEGEHLAAQLLEQRFRGFSFGKLLVGRQQFLKNL